MNISQAELLAHPLMAKVQADIAETRAKQQADRLAGEMDAQRLRGEQGKYLKAQYDQAIADYERLRQETHDAVGRIWAAVQAYSAVTKAHPQGFVESLFNEISVPSLIPNPSPYALRPMHTTTQVAVMGWFASQGKQWT